MSDDAKGIDDLLAEHRTFSPPAEFQTDALVVGTDLYDEANEDYEAFWAKQAAEIA